MRRALAACGLDEVITYTFVAPDAAAPLGLPEGDVRLRPVRLSNPMSVEQSVMRTTLLPGLIGALCDNIARLNDPPNLFELGRVYLWDDEVTPAPAHAAEPGVVSPHEPEAVAIVLSSSLRPEAWTAGSRATDFFTLKGVVEAALGVLRLQGEFAPLGEAIAACPYLHPGKSALVRVAGREIGVLGQLRPDVAGAFGVEDLALYVATLSLDRAAAARSARRALRGSRRLPSGLQDLAVVVSRDVPAATVVATARRAGGKLTRDVHVFDVYEGDQVPPDKRSLALRVVMRSPERTLSEKDIAGVRAKIVGALARDCGAALR